MIEPPQTEYAATADGGYVAYQVAGSGPVDLVFLYSAAFHVELAWEVTAFERVFTRFSRPDRAIAIYDAYGSVIDATASVKPFLGPIAPIVTEAIQRNAPARGFFPVAGRTTLAYAVPLQQDERVVGAAVVLLDAQFLELSEWDLWRRTAVRIGVLILLLTGITWLIVRWSVTRPTPGARGSRRFARPGPCPRRRWRAPAAPRGCGSCPARWPRTPAGPTTG